MMRKMMGFALATAVAFAASVASAQDSNVTGTVENIDPVAKTIVVDGQSYQMPDETTAGTPLEELKVGDKVNIVAPDEDRGDTETSPTAMMVEKIEE